MCLEHLASNELGSVKERRKALKFMMTVWDGSEKTNFKDSSHWFESFKLSDLGAKAWPKHELLNTTYARILVTAESVSKSHAGVYNWPHRLSYYAQVLLSFLFNGGSESLLYIVMRDINLKQWAAALKSWLYYMYPFFLRFMHVQVAILFMFVRNRN